MIKNNIKCLGLLKNISWIIIHLLFSIVNASNHTKCVSLSNQKCTTQLTSINLQPNEYLNDYITIHFRLI